MGRIDSSRAKVKLNDTAIRAVNTDVHSTKLIAENPCSDVVG